MADAGVCLVVVGGGEIGVNQIFLHLAGITRVGIFVDELLEDVNRLVERRASALVLGDGIVVECCFGDVAVVVELNGFFKRNRCLVEFVQLQVALTDVKVGALREGVAVGGHRCQAVHCLVEGIGAIANHAVGVGCRAQRFAGGGVDISFQIFFCLVVVAVLILAFANYAAQLGIKRRVIAVAQQRFGKRLRLVVLLLGEINLSHIVLSIIRQLAVALHALKLGERFAVAFVGIVDVGLIEGVGGGIAARASQRIDVHQRLLIFAKAQQRVGAAIINVLAGVAVECCGAHLVVFGNRFAILAVVEIVVGNGSLHAGSVDVRRMLCQIAAQGVEALAVAALIVAHGYIEIGTISHCVAHRHALEVRQLVDGARIISLVIHCFPSCQIAVGAGAVDAGISRR